MDEKKVVKIYHDNNWSENCSTFSLVVVAAFFIAGIMAGKIFGIEKFNVLAMIFVWSMSVFPLFIFSAIKNHFVNQEANLALMAEIHDIEYRETDKVFYIQK